MTDKHPLGVRQGLPVDARGGVAEARERVGAKPLRAEIGRRQRVPSRLQRPRRLREKPHRDARKAEARACAPQILERPVVAEIPKPGRALDGGGRERDLRLQRVEQAPARIHRQHVEQAGPRQGRVGSGARTLSDHAVAQVFPQREVAGGIGGGSVLRVPPPRLLDEAQHFPGRGLRLVGAEEVAVDGAPVAGERPPPTVGVVAPVPGERVIGLPAQVLAPVEAGALRPQQEVLVLQPRDIGAAVSVR